MKDSELIIKMIKIVNFYYQMKLSIEKYLAQFSLGMILRCKYRNIDINKGIQIVYFFEMIKYIM